MPLLEGEVVGRGIGAIVQDGVSTFLDEHLCNGGVAGVRGFVQGCALVPSLLVHLSTSGWEESEERYARIKVSLKNLFLQVKFCIGVGTSSVI